TLMMSFSNVETELELPRKEGIFQPQKQQQQPEIKQETTPAPPAKVLSSTATINVTKTKAEPGATLFINFSGITEPAPKDWIALYGVDAPNDQYGEWEYLDAKANGTVTFLAPGKPGIYEARLFLDWPSGGYYDVARTEKIQVGDVVEKPAAPTTKPASPLDKFRKKGHQASTSSGPTSFSASIDDPSKLYIY
ncbi:MAG: hypothetical protein GWM98_26810, partial [Nitrospinaceae bacterium]|nr:hypothetical protein [Nitrospinaceae bacterium]